MVPFFFFPASHLVRGKKKRALWKDTRHIIARSYPAAILFLPIINLLRNNAFSGKKQEEIILI